MIPRRQRIGFLKALSALYVDIKQVDLAVLGDLVSLAVKNIGRIADLPLRRPLRNGSGGKLNPELFRQAGKRCP